MAKVLIETANLTREEWLAWRRKGIGGSDAPVILGANKYQSSFDLWFDKVHGNGEIEDNDAMKWGRLIEPILAQNFMDKTGKKLRNRHAILQHDKYPFILASVDRLVVGEKAGWEGKTTNHFYVDSGEPKEIYTIQCQHYMAVTGLGKWYISVLSGGQKEYEYEIDRDDDFIDNVLIPAEVAFWDQVQNQELPEYDGSEACTKMLHEMYPQGNGESVMLGREYLDTVKQYKHFTQVEKEAKEEKARLSNIIKGVMGNHSKGQVGDYKLFWSDVSSKSFDSKAFQEAHPDLYGQFLRESSYRRFQIK